MEVRIEWREREREERGGGEKMTKIERRERDGGKGEDGREREV